MYSFLGGGYGILMFTGDLALTKFSLFRDVEIVGELWSRHLAFTQYVDNDTG